MFTRKIVRYVKIICLFFMSYVTISITLLHVNWRMMTIKSDFRRNSNKSWTLNISKEVQSHEKVTGNDFKTILSFVHELFDEPKEPVDLVYLWVNGSDPKFLLDMKRQWASEEPEQYQHPIKCTKHPEFGGHIHVIVVYPAIPKTKTFKESQKIKLVFNVTENNMQYTVIVPLQIKDVDGMMNVLTEIEGQMYLCLCGYIKLEGLNITNLDLRAAKLVLDIDSIEMKGLKKRPNPFQDIDQLRFSLRSVEKYASWIRHIYIITNEQIPSWLNTSNTRISVVFTKDLLPNKKDLPTFSSPVIESHMHRIPRLSETFLFMCDDFYLGKEVLLSDFYTKQEGYKISWDGKVGFCSPKCSHFDLGNGKCNKKCDNYKCGFDHGDCRTLTKSDMRIRHPIGLHYGSLFHTMTLFNRKKSMFDLSSYYLMPPHRPLLIQKHIAKDMEEIFREEFEQSSSQHFRSQFNVQYTMAYMKYISSALVTRTNEEIFDELEEVRPGMISYKVFKKFAETVLRKNLGRKTDALLNAAINCLGSKSEEVKRGLVFPKHLITNCRAIVDILTGARIKKLKYKHTVLTSLDSHFIMLSSLPHVKKDLGILKRSPRKFNGINDDIDHTKKESVQIKETLHNFYMSLFPTPSQFELQIPK